MLEQKVERIGRLLRALDRADGMEDYTIHRNVAIRYIEAEIARITRGESVTPLDPTHDELLMSLKSLQNGPEKFKRKTDHEILQTLLSIRAAEKQRMSNSAQSS